MSVFNQIMTGNEKWMFYKNMKCKSPMCKQNKPKAGVHLNEGDDV